MIRVCYKPSNKTPAQQHEAIPAHHVHGAQRGRADPPRGAHQRRRGDAARAAAGFPGPGVSRLPHLHSRPAESNPSSGVLWCGGAAVDANTASGCSET